MSDEAPALQGPPGTGKTSTIVAIVSALLAPSPLPTPTFPEIEALHIPTSVPLSNEEKRASILVCAQSNAAVDELVGRLTSPGILTSNGSRRCHVHTGLRAVLRFLISIGLAASRRARIGKTRGVP